MKHKDFAFDDDDCKDGAQQSDCYDEKQSEKRKFSIEDLMDLIVIFGLSWGAAPNDETNSNLS